MTLAPPFDTVEVSSDHTTNEEAVVYVETDAAAITVTLASNDAQKGSMVRIVDTDGNASSNNITVQTEGSESIFPGGSGSLSVAMDNSYVTLWSDGENWFAERNIEANKFSAPQAVDTSDLADDAVTEAKTTAGLTTAQDVSRNVQGEVNFQQAGTASATATQTGTAVTAQVQGSGRVVHDKLQGGITTGAGTMSLKRNGVTQVSGNPPLTTSGTVTGTSPTWTAEMNFTSVRTSTVTGITDFWTAVNGSTASGTTSDSLPDSGFKVFASGENTAGGPVSVPDATFSFYVNGSLVGNTIASQQEQIYFTETGTFTSPNVTMKVHAKGSAESPAQFYQELGENAVWLATGEAKASLTASKNEVTNVEQ